MKRSLTLSLSGAMIALSTVACPAAAQRVNTHSNTERGGVEVKQVPGRKIGNVTTKGNLVLLELDSGVIGNHNLFDLDKRTIRFTPTGGGGFRAENLALQWDAAIGSALQGNSVRLTKFAFPFSGKSWDSLQVLTTGLITFGGGYNDLKFDRFVHMKDAGRRMVDKIPVIAAFFKLRMNGTRYVNELADRLVVTWDVSEPTSGQQDVTFVRTPHHFQAVLHRDGRIDLSYQEMTARDGVVGVYTVPGGLPRAQSVDFSALKPGSAPWAAIFESFHHYGLPGSESMACTVIQALGDRFDFMVWYSDFRVDDQEAGTRSVGDIGQKVQGLGPRMDQGMRSSDYCSQGRLQVTWFQPVWVGSVQAQERHPDGRFPGYNMAVAQISHELAHRWSTRARAIVNGDTIELRGPHDPGGLSGATHWPQGVSTPVPFPFSRPVEASIMGGSNWKDNGDGTFTMLANGTMNPASGFSYLELYFMGLLPASGVPDFFMLRNQRNVGRTPEGSAIVAAEKIPITIRDIIAHNGPRVPAFENSPKAHNTAMVVVTLRGRKPDAAILNQVEGIGAAWISYWAKATGGVSTMTTSTGRP